VGRSLWAAITGHLDPQLAAIQTTAIHGIHCVLSIPSIVVPHEGESSAIARKSVSRNVNISNLAILLEDPTQIVWGGPVCKVIHLQGGHALDFGRATAVTHLFERFCTLELSKMPKYPG